MELKHLLIYLCGMNLMMALLVKRKLRSSLTISWDPKIKVFYFIESGSLINLANQWNIPVLGELCTNRLEQLQEIKSGLSNEVCTLENIVDD